MRSILIFLKTVRILFLSLFFTFLIVAGYFYFNSNAIKESLTQFILNDFSKSNIDVELGQVTFFGQGIVVDNINIVHKNFDIDAFNIKIKPSIKQSVLFFFLNNQDAVNFIKSVDVSDISISWNVLDDKTYGDIEVFDFDNSEFLNIISVFNLEKVSLAINKDSQKVFEAYGLSGEFKFDPDSFYRYMVNLKGDFFGDNNHASVDIMSSNLQENIDIRVVLDNISVNNDFEFFLLLPIKVKKGRFDGKVYLQLEKFSKLSARGNLFVDEIEWAISDSLDFKKTSAELYFDSDTIFLKNATANNSNNLVEVAGYFEIENYNYNLMLKEKKSKISNHFVKNMLPKIFVQNSPLGYLGYEVHISNDSITGAFSIDQFSLNKNILAESIKAELVYKNSCVKIKNAIGNLKESQLFFSGLYCLDSQDYEIVINGKLRDFPINYKNNQAVVSAKIDRGLIGRNRVDFMGEMETFSINENKFFHSNNNFKFSFIDYIVNVDVPGVANISTDLSDTLVARISGDISSLFLASLFQDVLSDYTDISMIYGESKIDIELEKKSDLRDFKGEILVDLKQKDNQGSIFLPINVKGSFKENFKVAKLMSKEGRLKMGGLETDLNFKGKFYEDSLEIEYAKFFNSSLMLKDALVDFSNDNSIQGEMGFYGFNISQSVLGKFKDIKGMINGIVMVSGNLNNPKIKGDLNINNIFYRDNYGPFSTRISLLYKDKALINKKKISLVYDGYGILDIKNLYLGDTLKVEFGHSNLRLGRLSRFFRGYSVEGIVDYTGEFNASSNFSNSMLTVSVGIQNAKVERFFLNNSKIKFKVKDDLLTIEDALVNLKGLSLRLKGAYPLEYSNRDSMNIEAFFRGNLIEELNRLAQIECNIVNEDSYGTIFIKHKNDALDISGKIRSVADKLEFEDYFKVLNDVEFDLELNNSVVSMLATATSFNKRDTLKVFNYFDVSKDNYLFSQQHPVDFGVIGIKTSSNGFPVHMGAFMDRDDQARLDLKGNSNFPHFSVHNNNNDIVVSGNIYISNANFTFPAPVDYEPSANNFFNEFVSLDVDIGFSRNVNYYYKSRKYLRGREIIRARIDESSRLKLAGPLDGQKLSITGNLISTRGTLFYGRNFRIETVRLDFVPEYVSSNSVNNTPLLSGKAYLLDRDANNVSRKIELTAMVKEEGSNFYQTRGRPGSVKFEISTPGFMAQGEYMDAQKELFAVVFGVNPEDVFEKDGTYNIAKKTVEIGEDYFMDRYVNSFISRHLKIPHLDVVRVRSNILTNYYNIQTTNTDNSQNLLLGTSLEVGSYITDRMFFNYEGLLDESIYSGIDGDKNIILRHKIGLEYTVNPMLQLNMGLNFNPDYNLHTPYNSYSVMFNFPLKF